MMLNEECVLRGMLEQCEGWVAKCLDNPDRWSIDFTLFLIKRYKEIEERLDDINLPKSKIQLQKSK